MKKLLYILILFTILLYTVLLLNLLGKNQNTSGYQTVFKVQSIDTMKYSRDLSRQELHDKAFDLVIDTQVKNIAATGANYIAIDTPYDEEFFPMLQRWVESARKYKLKVWFRGNWSGWEGWFDYPKIDRATHLEKTTEFILIHREIFENGDIFTACPECENGGPGDPRVTGDIKGYRQFLIVEYAVTKSVFNKIGKDVASNYDSMNGDVATAVMDKATTKALDGVVTIDHYVATPQQLADKVREIEKQTGGKVVLGEFGAPIPDINGDLTEDQQAAWLSTALNLLFTTPNFIGMNYWTNQGSTTALWNNDASPKKAVNIIQNFYSTRLVNGLAK